jgi:hypothetical protein
MGFPARLYNRPREHPPGLEESVFPFNVLE